MMFGSVCSGIEAASVAWNPIGWKAAWLSEIDAFPSAVLAHRFPGVDNLGDMNDIPRLVLNGSVSAPDVFTGGTPCQAFSVAGMREGLSDPRGALTIKFVEIANAIDHVRAARGDEECVIIWENVPGVLSDKENAFGCFLAALVGESESLEPSGGRWTDAGCVYGPQRAAAWRVLDAQYFGLAQRRRRVFVVASAREGFDPAAVLLESEGVRRDIAPRRGEGQDVAGTLASRSTGGGFPGTDEACSGYLQPVDAKTVSLRGREGGATAELGDDVAGCLRASSGGGDKPHVLTVHGTQDPCVSDSTAFALGRNNGGENVIMHAFVQNSRDEVRLMGGDGQIVGALAAEAGMKQQCYVTAPAVRRLTPRECERLQGFPDDWTMIPWRNKPADECPDGPRYKAIGNSWAVPVARWVGERVAEHLRRCC